MKRVIGLWLLAAVRTRFGGGCGEQGVERDRPDIDMGVDNIWVEM